jgi:hypothetical protein
LKGLEDVEGKNNFPLCLLKVLKFNLNSKATISILF